MKTNVRRRLLSVVSLCTALTAGVEAQTCETLINLGFSPNAGDIAAHPSVSNITPWVNGSETAPDPLGFGVNYMPDDDFGNGYAGLTVPFGRFGFKWGFEGAFDLSSAQSWDVCAISFDYNLYGQNGEASLALSVGSWSSTAPLPSTDHEVNGPVFTPVQVDQVASGTVTFNFLSDTLTVTRTGYAGYTTFFGDSLSLSSGTHAIDLLVSNTAPVGDGYFDVVFNNEVLLTHGFYQIDNFRITASQPIPEPSSALLGGLGALALLWKRRRSGC